MATYLASCDASKRTRILQLARCTTSPPGTTRLSSRSRRSSIPSKRNSGNSGTAEQTITHRPTPSRGLVPARNSRASPARTRIRELDASKCDTTTWAVTNPHMGGLSMHSRAATRVLSAKSNESKEEAQQDDAANNTEIATAECPRLSFIAKVDCHERIAELERHLAQSVARGAHSDETLREVTQEQMDKNRRNEEEIMTLQEKISELLESKCAMERQLSEALVVAEESRACRITETTKSESMEDQSSQLRALVVEMLGETEFWKQQAQGVQWQKRLEKIVAEEPVIPKTWQQPAWMDSVWGGERSVLQRHYENQIAKLQRHIDKLQRQDQCSNRGSSPSSNLGRSSSRGRGSRTSLLSTHGSQIDLQKNVEELCRKVKYLQDSKRKLEADLEDKNAYCRKLEQRLLEKPRRVSETKPLEMQALDVRLAHPGQTEREPIAGIRPFEAWCYDGPASIYSGPASMSDISSQCRSRLSAQPSRYTKDQML